MTLICSNFHMQAFKSTNFHANSISKFQLQASKSHFPLFSVYVVEAVSVEISGENVYSISYEDMQYFMFIEDKEATISCTVKGTDTAPNTAFLKVTTNQLCVKF